MIVKLKINKNTLEVECNDSEVDVNEIVANGDWITVEIAKPDADTTPEQTWLP